MRVKLTNSDSSGSPVTDTIVVTVGGERYERDVASTGTINVPDEVGEYLVESDGYAAEPYESDSSDGVSNPDEGAPLEGLDESEEHVAVDIDESDSPE